MKQELYRKLEAIGAADAIELAVMRTGCPAQIVIFNDAVYEYSPSSTIKHDNLDAYLSSYDAEFIAQDLGCDIDELGDPLDFSIDLRDRQSKRLK